MYFLFALVGALVLTAFVSANPVPSVDLYHVERAIFDGNQTGPFRGDPNADKYCVYGGVNSEEGYKDAEWVEIFIKRWDPNWDDKDTGQCAKDLFSDLQASTSDILQRSAPPTVSFLLDIETPEERGS